MFTYKTDKEGHIVPTNDRLVAMVFSQVLDVGYFQMFAPTPSSASAKTPAAVANENRPNMINLDDVQAFVRAILDDEMCMKLHGECGDKSGKTVHLNRSLYGLEQSGRQWAGLLVQAVEKYG